MKKTNLLVRETILKGSCGKMFRLLILGLLAFQVTAVAQQQTGHREITGPEADRLLPGAISVKVGVGTPYPAAVIMAPASSVPVRSFASWLRKAFDMPEYVDFRMLRQEKDKFGMEHARYVQTFRQVPVDRAHYVVHSRDSRIISFNGLAVLVPTHMSATPKLTEAQALKNALEHIGATQYKWQSAYWMEALKKQKKDPAATYYPTGELCWHVADDNQSFRLAWRFDIASASPDKLQRIYIDANTGSRIQTLPMESNCNAATVNTVFNGNRSINTDKFTANDYRLRDNCQGAIFHIRDWNSSTLTANPIEIQNTTNTWTTNDERFGGTVLWLTERSYAYWLSEHSRNSYDNAGGDIDGYINAKFDCSPPAGCVTDFNASMSFSGGTMKVGAGSGFADGYGTVDIIGHEFAHAVTGATSGLVYANESGALNESFSDIFGEAEENFVFGSNDWLLGDERSSGYIRNMSNPNDKNDPDTYLGTNWFTGSGDNGGVHTNSGVQNFWFYLLVVGGSGTNDNGQAYSVSGIGLDDASAIAYQNMISLSPNATYSDARDGAITAAVNLFGGCSNQVKQVTNAWHAVGVGARFFDATVAVTSTGTHNGRDVSCFNACDGSATVTVISGALPVISWSHGPTTASVSGLCPGNYSVTVTNLAGLGCSVTRNVTIQNTPQITAAPAATSNYNGFNISCNGEDDGTAAANAGGGTPPYSYSWNTVPVQTGATATGLKAGTYTVTVTDVNGCSISRNVTLTEPPVLATTASPTTNYNGFNVRCNGGSDGAAVANPSGGVMPYSYSWSPGGQTTQNATGLSATTYTVTVTDQNGCVASAQTTLTEPPPLTINAGPNKTVYYGYPDSACATLTATGIGGGVPPYTYSWSNGNTTTSTNVCPTTTTVYTVTVTDKNGCTMSDEVRVCVIDVRCGNNLDKVELCHFTGSQKNPYNTLCVALSGAKTHIAHGDQLAACGTSKVCNDNSMARMVRPANESEGYLTAFPNPLTDHTTVQFKLPFDQHAELKMFDISGRSLMMLYDDQAVGKHPYDLRLDASHIPAGVYFLILKTSSGESYTSKLIITR